MASRNESTITSPNANPASQCALYVALQTMKERCLSLQLRLTSVQEDNLALRQAHIQPTAATDSQELLALVQELSHSKERLNDRLNMVASENRHLWSRLSHMTKAISVEVVTSDKPKAAPPMPNTSNQTTNPNLIRSKTFTQNAPNPALRSKMQPEVQCAITDLSLEEISLKVLSEILDSKAELERICGEMSAPTSSKAANAYGFGYLNDDDAHDVTLSETGGGGVGDDVQLELKRCSEGMVEIRAEVLRQQSDIKVALSNLRKTRSKKRFFFFTFKFVLNYGYSFQASKCVRPASTTCSASHHTSQQPTKHISISPIRCRHSAKVSPAPRRPRLL